jgi:hypothetical protein
MFKENEDHIVFVTTALCQVCKYLMTDMCPDCMANKMDRFEPADIPFHLLRVFSMQEYESLPNGAKARLLAYYLIAIMNYLNGYSNGNNPHP